MEAKLFIDIALEVALIIFIVVCCALFITMVIDDHRNK